MKALIFENKVVDIVDKEFEVHKSMTWVDATDATEHGGSWDGKNFGPADTRTDEEKAAEELALLRSVRNIKLKESDHWAYEDTPTMSQDQKDYRQELRDITKTYQSMDADGFKWPTKP